MTGLLSRPFSIRRLNKAQSVRVEASAQEREAIAKAYNLLAVDRLSAALEVRPWKGDGVAVAGSVDGDVTQACIVSLDPVPGQVSETLERRFSPDPAAIPTIVDIDPDKPDPPELLEHDVLDLGAIALEHFLLGLPDYPRAAGAVLDAAAQEEAEPSPFAVLAALKNNSD